MAIITITPRQVAEELGTRGYRIKSSRWIPVPDPLPDPGPDIIPVPDPHVPHVPVIPPVPPPVPPIPGDDPRSTPLPDVIVLPKDHVPYIPPVPPPVPPIPGDDPRSTPLPDIDIHVPVLEESAYAKYLRFLPLLALLVPEKHITDFTV